MNKKMENLWEIIKGLFLILFGGASMWTGDFVRIFVFEAHNPMVNGLKSSINASQF
jgi:hypothetical protein